MINTKRNKITGIPLQQYRGGELFICALILLLPFFTRAQSPDSVKVQPFGADTTIQLKQQQTAPLVATTEKPSAGAPTIHSVRKATLLSAVLPGAGQVYNKRTWKVPIIYAAFGGLVYLVKFNSDRFKTYENALLLRYDNDPETVDEFKDLYTDDNLKSLRDFYRRNRDLSVIGISMVYVLNIIDAHVDAHLFNFNVDDNLSLNWSPMLPASSSYQGAGISFHLTF
ncbi:MAG: DUF5683 domain-containing protein [Bacteroidia bacterium]